MLGIIRDVGGTGSGESGVQVILPLLEGRRRQLDTGGDTVTPVLVNR